MGKQDGKLSVCLSRFSNPLSPIDLSHKLIFFCGFGTVQPRCAQNVVTSHTIKECLGFPLICVFLCYFCHSPTQRKVCLHGALVQMVTAIRGWGYLSLWTPLVADNEGLPAGCNCIFITLKASPLYQVNSCLTVTLSLFSLTNLWSNNSGIENEMVSFLQFFQHMC